MVSSGNDATLISGETPTFSISVTESDGVTPLDLSDALEIVWVLNLRETKVEKTLGEGIELGSPDSGGVISTMLVTLQEDDTKDVLGMGTYFHEARLTDLHGVITSVTTGTLTILESLVY